MNFLPTKVRVLYLSKFYPTFDCVLKEVEFEYSYRTMDFLQFDDYNIKEQGKEIVTFQLRETLKEGK